MLVYFAVILCTKMNSRELLDRLLSQVAEKLNWKNFKISGVDHENGHGFLGEFFLTSITNTVTNEKLELAVKKAFTHEGRREELSIQKAFRNETYFYKEIIPTLMAFKDSKKVQEPIEFFTKFYGSHDGELEECLVMENLKLAGYSIIDREAFLSQNHVEFLFKEYGKFHALSFALRDQHPEEYKKLVDGIFDFISVSVCGSDGFQKSLKNCAVSAFECIDEEMQENCREYLNNTRKVFNDISHYKGKYNCIVHGDCWSNNMMFKYEDGKVAGVKLIDFQLIRESTPVHDLSYFLYAGTTKECYSNIDNYLEIYHVSFSKMCRDLGSNPDQLYPFDALKEDWKKYCKFGIMWGFMHNKIKLVDEKSMQNMCETDFFDIFANMKVNDDRICVYRQRIRDLFDDVYKREYLKFK